MGGSIMSKNKISEYSSSAAGNTDIGGINIGEGMLPSDVNNSIRELMAQLKHQQAGTDGDNFTVGGNLDVSGTASITGDTSINSTGAIKVPVGTTAQRPTAATGKIRYNTTLSQYEGYDGSSWSLLGGGATGGGGDQVFVENTTTVTTSYSLPSGKNAMSVGAITINSGVSVTVPSGQRWVIL
jgi:hypothetical protein